MLSKYYIRQYIAAFLVGMTLLPVGCNGLKSSKDPTKQVPPKIENSEELREKIAGYEQQFNGQVDQAYKLFRNEMSVPVAKLTGNDELHIEFALSGKDFWKNLRVGFTEIGRDTRADFTDQFITLPHQGGIRVGFVDLIRAKAIWSAIRGDTQTDLIMALDIPLVPDRVMQEDPKQYRLHGSQVIDLGEKGTLEMSLSQQITVIPKGHVVDVQGAKFDDGSLRFAQFDIRFPDLKQDGRRNVRTKRSGSLKQIKTTTWREAPKVRREKFSLSQLVLPKGVALVALVPTDCMEVSESSDWTSTTYIPTRNKISTSMILLVMPKRVSEAFKKPPEK